MFALAQERGELASATVALGEFFSLTTFKGIAMQLFFVFFCLMVVSYLTSYLAHQRGRDRYVWFTIGFMFGFLALLVLFILPNLNAAKDEELISQKKTSLAGLEANPAAFDNLSQQDSQEAVIDQPLWYYVDNDWVQCGPVAWNDISENVQKGILSKSTFVWKSGMDNWLKIGQLEQ